MLPWVDIVFLSVYTPTAVLSWVYIALYICLQLHAQSHHMYHTIISPCITQSYHNIKEQHHHHYHHQHHYHHTTTLPSHRGHTDDVQDISWAPDGTAFATASVDNNCIVWDAYSKNPIIRFDNHKHYVQVSHLTLWGWVFDLSCVMMMMMMMMMM